MLLKPRKDKRNREGLMTVANEDGDNHVTMSPDQEKMKSGRMLAGPTTLKGCQVSKARVEEWGSGLTA